MADEKTTPTPKVGKTDTMHSTPDTPDRSAEAETRQSEADVRGQKARDESGGTLGAERPGKETLKTENFGTLVTDMPDLREQDTGGEEPVNPGNEGPTAVARQPYESAEEAGKRIQRETKEAEKAKSK